MREECSIEGCLCHTSIQPLTDAVYGEKTAKRKSSAVAYEARGHDAPVWRRLPINQLRNVASRHPKARRFAARRKDEHGPT